MFDTEEEAESESVMGASVGGVRELIAIIAPKWAQTPVGEFVKCLTSRKALRSLRFLVRQSASLIAFATALRSPFRRTPDSSRKRSNLPKTGSSAARAAFQ